MPQSTVNIIVKGVVIFYQSEGVTKLIFPIDEDCHRVSFTHQKEGEYPSPVTNLGRAGRQIEVTARNAASTTGLSGNIDKFIDLTANYSHSDGINMKKDWRDRAVEMTIENAQVALKNLSKRKFALLENDVIRKKADRIGDDFIAEIILKSNGQLSVGYQEAGRYVSVFESEQNSSYTLVINNDCEILPQNARNDFEMFYDVIEDAKNPNRKFKLVGLKPQSKYELSNVGEKVSASIYNETFNENAKSDFPCKPVWISQPV